MTETSVRAVAERSWRATWGFVSAVIAAVSAIPFVPGPYFEYLFGGVAIVLGLLGFRDASQGMRGKGLAVAAVVLGALVVGYKFAVSGLLG